MNGRSCGLSPSTLSNFADGNDRMAVSVTDARFRVVGGSSKRRRCVRLLLYVVRDHPVRFQIATGGFRWWLAVGVGTR